MVFLTQMLAGNYEENIPDIPKVNWIHLTNSTIKETLIWAMTVSYDRRVQITLQSKCLQDGVQESMHLNDWLNISEWSVLDVSLWKKL